MKLGVYSLQNVLFDGQAVSLNCVTQQGEITVLDHHEALITILEKGIMTIIDAEKKEVIIPITSGFLEIDLNGHVRAMVETAV